LLLDPDSFLGRPASRSLPTCLQTRLAECPPSRNPENIIERMRILHGPCRTRQSPCGHVIADASTRHILGVLRQIHHRNKLTQTSLSIPVADNNALVENPFSCIE